MNIFFKVCLIYGMGVTLSAVLLSMSIPARAQLWEDGNNFKSTDNTLEADSLWNSLPIFDIKGSFRGGRDESFRIFKEIEVFKRLYRNQGIKFWQRFPNDNRRFLWFAQSVKDFPEYWEDLDNGAYRRVEEMYESKWATIPVDSNLINEWNAIYPQMRSDFLSSPSVSDSLKNLFLHNEMTSYLLNHKNSYYRLISPLKLDSLQHLFVVCVDRFYQYYKSKYQQVKPFKAIEILFKFKDQYQLSTEDLKEFLTIPLSSEIVVLKSWAESKMALFKLEAEPFHFKGTTIDGLSIDIQELRGRVVLLDFWNITCTACIGRMHEIKPIYEKYRKLGFEVLSISIDSEDRIDNIRKIKEKVGANWPTFAVGGKTRKDWENSIGGRIWAKYSFFSVPQLILLGKNGLMREVNGVLRNGDFEPLVKELLNE